jgi:3-oxoacyl-[acyl-carrier protein] reductase
MVFVITGGSRGIGAEVVKQAVEAGYDVAFTYNKNIKAAEAVVKQASSINKSSNCKIYKLDIRNSSSVDKFYVDVISEFGTVDVVVSNAGINRNAPLMTMLNDEWDDVIETNLTGAFYLSRAFIPGMLEQRYGRFIFISSVSKDGLSGQANYAATKAGLLGLSRTIAKEYGNKGITSNVVSPGMIDTDMTRENMSKKYKKYWDDNSVLHRSGTVEEVASAIMFFAQKNATYINGTCLPVTSALDWMP